MRQRPSQRPSLTGWAPLSLFVVGASLWSSPWKPVRESIPQTHSSSIAISPDGSRLYVVHPDADSVSILDLATRTIEHEIPLADPPRLTEGASRRFDPAVSPRALTLGAGGATLFVTGQRSGRLYAIDTAKARVVGEVDVCSEPIGVLTATDAKSVFVACSQDDEIVEVDARALRVTARVPCGRKPWALARGSDDHTLWVTHLLGPGLSMLDTKPLAVRATSPLLESPAGSDPTHPHGQARGMYDAALRPGTGELWVAHLLLGTDTPQPALDFERTVFPALSIVDDRGAALARLSVHVKPGDNGAFGDVVSGPHAVTFSADGRFAFLLSSSSEDLLVVDAVRRVQAQLVRPLPGHLPEGLVTDDHAIYVQERNTEDIAVLAIHRTSEGIEVVPDGPPFKSLRVDPMPAHLRLGQKVFSSANSDDVPTTQNHWVACASCHIEGRSDAVTWRFTPGPRDTPSNAGGTRDTGFLFRTGDRASVEDYWVTINVEQGGHFDPEVSSHKQMLVALAAYVDEAIAAPVPPRTNAAIAARGESVFQRVGCATCHAGPARTDSGVGNPSLDLGGPVLVHDVGTCVTGPAGAWLDVDHEDEKGHKRGGCAFDTPALRGLVDSAPYMHDGSAATLDDAVTVMLKAAHASNPADAAHSASPASYLDSDDRAALVEFLRSL